MSEHRTKIDIGDLCFDDDNKIFGVVAELVDHEYSYVIYWDDGKKHWVDYETAYRWKSNAWKLHEQQD